VIACCGGWSRRQNARDKLVFDFPRRVPIMPALSLKLLSSMATRELLGELISRYQRSTARAVTSEAAGGVDVAKRVRAGEAVDVVILSSTAIDSLIAAGSLLPDSRIDLVKSGVSIAVHAGASRPDVTSEEAVKRAVLAAKTLSYSTGPSGVYLEKLFERWGILAQIRSRIVVPPPGVPVGSLVANGTVELGFQQLSELMTLPGIEVIGPLPPQIQTITIFSGGISPGCVRPELARALLDYLASPSVSETKRRYGMDPA
jgi:molybdate transport system substrate-binding protein